METNKAKKIALTVSIVTIVVNLLLTVFKIVAGILGNSSAMISDAVHSASDVISTVIVIIGVVIASLPADDAHQYGHERLECIASIILSVLLFITGLFIGYDGLEKIISGSYKNIPKPEMLALIAAIVSIAIKEGMFWWTIINAKRINSLALKADAWHHRSDALSSVGSLLGIGCALIFNAPIFDVIASLIICLFIIKVAIDVFREATDKMVDKACPPEKIDEIKKIVANVEGVISIDKIQTRMFGNKIYVDIEIGAYKNLTLESAHKIAQAAHDKIEELDKNIKHCMVHVNPIDIHVLENINKDAIKDDISE